MNIKPEILAIIPARGNSKSIHHKNIREFAGYPLIAFSIAAARQSAHVSRVIVSTDDAEIAQVAREYGAEVPFMRPVELAQDDTLDYPVIEHVLRWLVDNENYHPEFVMQLRPTSPIRPETMVDEAVKLMLSHPEADSVRGVVPSAQNPYKMWFIDVKGQMKPILNMDRIKEPYNAPRQDLPNTYWQTGHIDVIRVDMILEKKSLTGDIVLPLMVDPLYSVDIDTPLDWERAESCAQEGLLRMVWPGNKKRAFPDKVALLVMDFDGVLTDDRVWVDGDGNEMVAASRGDGLGLERLRQLTDIQVMVISKETNRVVAARCKKLDIPLIQSVNDKPKTLEAVFKQRGIPTGEVIYMGNDLNDLDCFPMVGFSIVPGSALPEIKRKADFVLQKNGGFGAVRELCELLIARYPSS
ncbi:MAG TPA: acylneuraminate cytidylyltransferase [Pelolinea sp.]|nr:acylneuraminate cytidylyltransferase [Pelolinea sp.]